MAKLRFEGNKILVMVGIDDDIVLEVFAKSIAGRKAAYTLKKRFEGLPKESKESIVKKKNRKSKKGTEKTKTDKNKKKEVGYDKK